MAHKAMNGGTVYEVKGGKCLVSGTGYTIQKGRALVNGTGYDVSFGGGAISVTITGTGATKGPSATIAGVEYTKATTGLEVFAGDIIFFQSGGYFGTTNKIVIDGVTVASGSNITSATYNWTVPSGISAITIAFSSKNNTMSVTVTTS